MSTIIGRTAFTASRRLYRPSGANAAADAPPIREQITLSDRREGTQVLRRGAKRDPELYVLYGLTLATLGVSGWVLTTHPVSDDGPVRVEKVPESEPWKDNSHQGKYKFYPQGDFDQPPRPGPSALHATIVPNVNLPRELHEQFNKYGKDEYALIGH